LQLGERHDPHPATAISSAWRAPVASFDARCLATGVGGPLRSVEKPASLAGSTEVPPLVKVNPFVTPFCWITSTISLYARKSRILRELSLFKHHITAHRVSSQPVLHPLVAMQRIADYVGRHGYHWWTSGSVEEKRLPRLRAKFETLYGIALSMASFLDGDSACGGQVS
jgi:hypothetical protein